MVHSQRRRVCRNNQRKYLNEVVRAVLSRSGVATRPCNGVEQRDNATAVQRDGTIVSRGMVVSALYRSGCGMWDVGCGVWGVHLGLVKREEK